jgi:hypothetical protein
MFLCTHLLHLIAKIELLGQTTQPTLLEQVDGALFYLSLWERSIRINCSLEK